MNHKLQVGFVVLVVGFSVALGWVTNSVPVYYPIPEVSHHYVGTPKPLTVLDLFGTPERDPDWTPPPPDVLVTPVVIVRPKPTPTYDDRDLPEDICSENEESVLLCHYPDGSTTGWKVACCSNQARAHMTQHPNDYYFRGQDGDPCDVLERKTQDEW